MIIRNSIIQTFLVVSCLLLPVESFDFKDAITARLRFHKGDVHSEDEATEGSSHSSFSTKDDGSWTLPKIGVGFKLYFLGSKKKSHGGAAAKEKTPKKIIWPHPPASHFQSHQSHHQVFSAPPEELTYGLNQRFPFMPHHQEGGNNMQTPLFPYRQQQQSIGVGGGGQSFDFPYKGNYPGELHSEQEEQHQSFGVPQDIHTKFVAHSTHNSGSSGGASHLRNPGPSSFAFGNVGTVGDLRDNPRGFMNGVTKFISHSDGSSLRNPGPSMSYVNVGNVRGNQGLRHEVVVHSYPENHGETDHVVPSAEEAPHGHHGLGFIGSSGSPQLQFSSQGQAEDDHSGLSNIPQFKPFPGHSPQRETYENQEPQYYTINEDSGGGREQEVSNSPGLITVDEQETSASVVPTHSSPRSHKPHGRLSGDDKLLKTLRLVLDIARATKHEDKSQKKSVLIRNPNSVRAFKRAAEKRSSSVVETGPILQKTSESKDVNTLEGDLTRLILSLENKKGVKKQLIN